MTLALKRSGMEDGVVAEAAHVTAAWLSAVKNDRIKSPPIDKLIAVADVTRVPRRFLTEPLGVVPIGDEAETDWPYRMREDPTIPEELREAMWRMTLEARRLREAAVKER